MHLFPWKSTALFGLVLALAINIALEIFQPASKVDPTKLPSTHTWIWWRTQEFAAQKTTPPVVLLGSSLMMIPISMQDAEYLRQPLDASQHWQSAYMQTRLEQQLLSHCVGQIPASNQLTCFNFAMPGAMVSDDYMIARTLLQDNHKPKVIVLGITLRDFVDSHLSCAAATDVFKYLSRFQSVDDLVALSMPQIWQRLDYALSKGIWLVGKRLDLQVMLSDAVKNHIKPANASPISNQETTPTTNIASKLKAEVEPGMFVLAPGDSSTYEDNSAEYRTRFKAVSATGFANQEQFLEMFCRQANDRGIKVVLANMPLTRENMALMPSGSYDHYLATVKNLSTRFHISFVDLNDGHTFTKVDFKDTAHMNAHGGQKLTDTIVKTITGNQQLSNALVAPGATDLATTSKVM